MKAKTKAYQHKDAQRTNIPTDRDQVFMTDEDRERVAFSPEPAGTGGPVLSWRRGPGVQDIKTDALPLYIHEKVNPSAFIEQLTQAGAEAEQMDWFAEFNGLPADAKYDWYKFKGHWSNRIIRGNSVDVMASLAAKEGMTGQVQMVFFDPPYGINFASNYQSSTRERALTDTPVEAPSRKAFRDTYIDGLHSYMDTVFKVSAHARALLSDSGSFFLQIGVENVHRASIVLDEVFGPDNRVATVAFAKSGATSAQHLSQVANYLLWYAKDKNHVKYRQLYEPLTRREKLDVITYAAMLELPDGTCRNLTLQEKDNADKCIPEDARLFSRVPLTSQGESTTGQSEPYSWNGTMYRCPPGRHWSVKVPEGMDRLAARKRLSAADSGSLRWKQYEDELPGRRIHNLWHNPMSATDMHYVVETAESVIDRCILMSTDPGDLVLDPTCGSGTTAAVAERWGRRWITIDASAIPVALCRQRILASVHQWYLTLDGSDGQREEAQLADRLHDYEQNPGPTRSGADPSAGFVYERVPYVSAAHLAYDEPPKATLLVNQPVVKKGVKRISAPFTVESHSPWIYLSPSAPEADERTTERETGIRENVVKALEVAGVPAPDGEGDRWRFDGIQLWDDDPSSHITHEAVLRGSADRVAIAVVPDDQTAGLALIDTAAREAVRRAFSKLVVVAFHFEADPKNERRGKLQIVLARANRDLTIGELRSGKEDHAFVLVGEPDVELVERPDGTCQVALQGYHVYDPSSGNVRPGGKPTDIDCWMLDTDYDGKSFFARRIHFPGKSADRQIKHLKAALGRRVDTAQWEHMESLTSAPFRRTAGGRVAVRIVTTFGDEMLCVREVAPLPTAI